jgi:hypothetical protein
VVIEHPLEKSMEVFDFTSAVLDKSTTFILESWICITNGLGGFNSHLVDSKKPEASTSTRSSELDEFINNLDELLHPNLVL